jgi:CubicO group peptidase (beta-lactamase class C family)
MTRADGGKVEKVDALFAGCYNGRLPGPKEPVPGAAVMVIEEGKVRLRRFYGQADLERGTRITGRTAFRLASLTKPFTAMAIMILQERGRLHYEDPLSEFVPRFPAYARKITVRHLLNHTSGLPEYACLFANTKRKAWRIDIDWPRSSLMKPSRYEPRAADVPKMLAREGTLQFEPGDCYAYNNSEYIVLAQIVEKLSGKRFRRFLATEIFRKAGMNHSLLHDDSRPRIPYRAKGYTEGMCGRYRDIDYTPLNLIYGEDGIYTTIEDMFRWDQAIEQNKLVRPETFAKALEPGKLNNGNLAECGFGWLLEKLGKFDAFWHDGEWAGFRTYYVRIPARRLAVAVLANLESINAPEIGGEIARITWPGHELSAAIDRGRISGNDRAS